MIVEIVYLTSARQYAGKITFGLAIDEKDPRFLEITEKLRDLLNNFFKEYDGFCNGVRLNGQSVRNKDGCTERNS